MQWRINFDGEKGPTKEEKHAEIVAIKAGEYEFSRDDLDKKHVLEYLYYDEGMRNADIGELLDVDSDTVLLALEWWQIVVFPGLPPLMVRMNGRKPW